MSRVVVNMRLERELVERVDAVAGPRGRTRFVEVALERALSGAVDLPAPGAGRMSAAPVPASAPESEAAVLRAIVDRRTALLRARP